MDRAKQQKNTLIIFIIGALLIATVGGYILFKNWMVRYKSELYGFSIKYPMSWEKRENVDGAAAVFIAPLDNDLDYFPENVNIVVQDLSGNPVSLTDYSETAIKQMKIVFEDAIEIVDSAPTTMDGLPAHRFIFIGKGPELEFKFLCVWTILDNKAYQVIYTSMSSQYDQYVDKAKAMMGSFKAP